MNKAPTPMSDQHSKHEMLKSRQQILNKTALLSLATVSDDGSAHINTAFFCNQDEELFFLSDVRSVHCQNLLRRPHVAATVFDSRQSWSADKAGIQISGTASICRDASAALARKRYAKRFPQFASYLKSQRGHLDKHLQFFAIHIVRYKVLDEKKFGEEIYVSAST